MSWDSKMQAKEQIFSAVSDYFHQFHESKSDDHNGDEQISYAGRIYDQDEMILLVDAALDFWLTGGCYTERFEKEFAAYLDVGYCSLVNSGSSANLLAFMALTSPLLGGRKVCRGDEVITVAAGFPTTVTPLIQYGAVPVFIDVTIPQYNVDVIQLEEAYSEKTKAVMLAHTMGNPFDLQAVKSFCEAHNLWLIEDNCDALGSKCKMDGGMFFTGTVGDIGTSSFYPPHHMTMGEGGAVYTNNPLLYRVIRSMRDWGRDCICASGQDNRCGHRFDGQFGALPAGYDHKYVYSHFGYNLKATDMQAAIGCAQLKKLPDFIKNRKANYTVLYNELVKLGAEQFFILPEAFPSSEPSWFGFLLTCKAGISRERVVKHVEACNIQTRMLFAGNLLRHPCFTHSQEMLKGNDGRDCYRTVGDLKNTDTIMKNTFWVGVYPGMNQKKLERIARVIMEAATHARL